MDKNGNIIKRGDEVKVPGWPVPGRVVSIENGGAIIEVPPIMFDFASIELAG